MKFINSLTEEVAASINSATIQKFYIERPEEDDEYYRLKAQASDGTNTLDLYETEEEAQEALEKLIDSLKTCRFLRVNGVMINVENIVEAKVIPPSDMTRTDRYEVRLFYRGVGNDYYRPEGLKLQAATLGIYDTPERAYERLDELMDQLND